LLVIILGIYKRILFYSFGIFSYHFVAAKFGVEPSGCVELAKHVSLGCPNLEFSGLMTIGMLDYSSTPENFKVTVLT
jgi:hypothetical protein